MKTTEKPVSYAEFVMALCKPGEAIVSSLTPDKAHIWHMATGVSGEAGELLDAVKKHVLYGKPLDIENVVEELGDLKFYITGLMEKLGISEWRVEEHNRAKLGERYKSLTYSDEAAQTRADKQPEITVYPKFPTFWVNGRLITTEERTSLTYADVLALAGMRGTPTVTYHTRERGDTKRSGIMHPGDVVEYVHLLQFNCVHTGDA